MLPLSRGIGIVPALMLLMLLQACAGAVAPPAGSSDPSEVAAQARQINLVASRFENLINRTAAYDSLAYGVRDEEVSPTKASEDARKLSDELRREHEGLSAELRRQAQTSEALQAEDWREGLDNLVAVAENQRESSRAFIELGEALVEAAVAGDLEGLRQTEARRLRRFDSHLEQQLALIDVQLAQEDRRDATYYLTAAARSQVQALRALMDAALKVHGSGQPADAEEQRGDAERWIRLGLGHVATGREILPRNLRDVRSSGTARRIGTRYQRVVIELLEENYPKSFDAEERILQEMKASVDLLFLPREEGRDPVAGELAALIDRINELSRERTRLTLERQQRVAAAR